ncbi:mapk-regulated corepressor-interacting protein 1 isoform X1 [Stegostoma tigrinum]|uniref:mapk-regulated corepressor-interacting protein 1 isoform X1 n=1 Tax=Stegostoma tigrinum TaxID=3053191 RepID=UPI00202B417A|nr:mapk-regulated corepressor-interacting protein 1 isoform X1 [Stegostoma tigrinum]
MWLKLCKWTALLCLLDGGGEVRSSPAPRIVYNGKRNNGPRSPTNTAPQEIYTPAHEENVRFIHEAWQCVEQELRSQMSGNERGPVQYVEKNPNPNLNNFTPVDLSDLKKRSMSDAKKS